MPTILVYKCDCLSSLLTAISWDENSSDRVDEILDLSSKTFLLELVLPNIASVSQTRCVKDADLRKRLRIRVLTTFRSAGAYYYAVVAVRKR